MIKLSKEAVGKSISVIEMAPSDLGSFIDEKVIASGFGSTETSFHSNSLLQTELTTISNQNCTDHLKEKKTPVLVTPQTICATREEAGICDGDSGGPLMAKINGMNVLIGASSWSASRKCEASTVSAFTRISAYRDWIDKIMAEN